MATTLANSLYMVIYTFSLNKSDAKTYPFNRVVIKLIPCDLIIWGFDHKDPRGHKFDQFQITAYMYRYTCYAIHNIQFFLQK